MKNFKKAMAVVLTAILISQVALPLFAYGQDEKYTGKMLMAINTNYDGTDASFTTAAGEADDEDADYYSEEAAPDVIDDVEVLSPAEADAAAKKLKGSDKNQPDSVGYEVGDKKTIGAHYAGKPTVDLECSYVGEYCTVWHETEYSEMSKEEKTEKCISLGKDADKIIPLELELLGDVRIDTDKDGKIAIFVFKMTDKGGYFTVSSLVDKSGRIGNVFVSYGNNNCCDSINLNDYFDSNYEYMISAIAHEYQHYINACYDYYGKTNLTYLNDMELYLNEGFAEALGLLLADFTRTKYPTYYFNNYYNSLVANHTGSFSYNLGFLFCQYMRTRYAALTGDSSGDYPGSGFYRKVLESRNRDNHDNTLGIIADMLYPESEYKNLKNTDERCRQLIVDYWMASLLNEPTGDHGFNGDEWARQLVFDFGYIAQYHLPGPDGDEILSGNANLYYINGVDIGDAVITSADEGIVFVALGEDWPTLSLTDESGEIYERFVGTSFIPDYYYKPTYKFSGWSSVKGATEPEYYAEDLISIEKDLTLYPIIADNAITVEEDTAYSYSESELEENSSFKFTAKNTGYYRFAIGDAFIAIYDENCIPFRNTNSYYDEKTSSRKYSFYLEQGKNYRFAIYDFHKECGLTFSFLPQTYTLTCYDNCPDTENEYFSKSEGDVTYFLHESYDDFYTFKGWAESKDSDVKYKAGELITLDSDLTLYGVWEEPKTVSEGTITVPYGERIYIFIPEKSGIYQIDSVNISLEIYEFKEETTYYYGSRHYLEKGKTYYISVSNHNSESSEINLYYDDTAIQLIYWIDLSGSSVDLYSESGNGKFVVPDLPVYSPYYSKFLGWSREENSDYAEYEPGDTIYLEFDTDLYPVWDQSSAKPVTIKTLFETINWLLFKFYPFYFRNLISSLF